MIVSILTTLAMAQTPATPETPVTVTLAAPALPVDVASLTPEALSAAVELARVPGVDRIEATVQRVLIDSSRCMVLVDWAYDYPTYVAEVQSTGGGQADDARSACLSALAQSAENAAQVVVLRVVEPPQATLSPALPATDTPPEPVAEAEETVVVVDEPMSRGQRWMVRGGFTFGAGATLAYLGGTLGGGSDVGAGMIATGAVTGLVGLGMAAAGLAMGDDDRPNGSFQVVPGPRSGLGIRFRPPLRKRRR